MAAPKLEINRGASPMYYTEERLDETREQGRDRRNKLEDVRSKKSRILIKTEISPEMCKIEWLLSVFPILSPTMFP